jgi:hypothetical protein
MMDLKKKLTMLVISVEGLESNVDRLKQERKNRYNHMENTIQAEIDTLKLFKDRVDLELQIVKNQNRMGETLGLTQNKLSNNHGTGEDADNGRDNYLKEVQDMKKRMLKMERENELLKKNSEEGLKLLGDRIGEVSGAVTRRSKIDGNLKKLINNDGSSGVEIYSEMSLDQLSDFCNLQKRINRTLNDQMEEFARNLTENSR